ncbi:MAG: argininosuccinate synthase, partial [Burkholderiales bacterium]|nr:argininosuccinate synthase [Burkholderiales bacterium]
MSKTTKSAKTKAVKAAKATQPVVAPVAAPATAAAGQKVKKVVLAYSGGLDTSIILKWLQDEYNCEVVTFTADIG